MHTWKPTTLRLNLGRGGGFGGAGHSFERGFGVMTHQAPFENGLCGPDEVVGEDGTCAPRTRIMMGYGGFQGIPYRRRIDDEFCSPEEWMGWDGFCHRLPELGQTASPAAPANSTPIAVTAALVGLGAGATQLLTGNGSMLNKIAFWTEIGALVVLASIVVGKPK